MSELPLHEFHAQLGAEFISVQGQEAVAFYAVKALAGGAPSTENAPLFDPNHFRGELLAERAALRESAGVMDLSFRGRIVLTGEDRQRFLNGQVTNNVQALKTGEGCYAALVTAKGKMLSDLNIYLLENEILLDFEPGLTAAVSERLEKYIIADDAQIVDVAPLYGLLSVQGPKAGETLQRVLGETALPDKPLAFASLKNEALGEIYVMNMDRAGGAGFDLFVPSDSLAMVFDKLIASARQAGGLPYGWRALEMARIEAGIPRFGADMDEANLPPEAGLEQRAISYNKGCYIGQEVIARIRTYGQVAKALRGLRLADDLKMLPAKGDKLIKNGREVGFITSALASPSLRANIALGYVRRESNQIGNSVTLRSGERESEAAIVELPFTSLNAK